MYIFDTFPNYFLKQCPYNNSSPRKKQSRSHVVVSWELSCKRCMTRVKVCESSTQKNSSSPWSTKRFFTNRSYLPENKKMGKKSAAGLNSGQGSGRKNNLMNTTPPATGIWSNRDETRQDFIMSQFIKLPISIFHNYLWLLALIYFSAVPGLKLENDRTVTKTFN